MASLTVVKDFDVVEDRVREFDSGFPYAPWYGFVNFAPPPSPLLLGLTTKAN